MESVTTKKTTENIKVGGLVNTVLEGDVVQIGDTFIKYVKFNGGKQITLAINAPKDQKITFITRAQRSALKKEVL
jgi:ribosomal protein L30E